MAIDRKKMAESLKILAENPGKIKAQEKLYQQRLAEIREKEKSGNWSPNSIAREKAEALEARNRTSHALAHAMAPALAYVRENNDYSALPIDLDNSKLQRALNMVSLMGKSLSYSDQANLINQFRGDPASLRVMEAAFSKNGQDWAAKTAREMQKPISNRALDEMSVVLSFHDYSESKGEFSFPFERMMWSHPEFRKQADKLGLDFGEVADPFTLALDMTMESIAAEELNSVPEEDPVQEANRRAKLSAQKYKIANAKNEISKAIQRGEDPAKIFNTAMKAAENISQGVNTSAEA